ncbi:MAG: SPOR domain-containing protein, partial [Methylobacter sp.]
VDGFITELKGNHQSPVDLLTNKVPDIVAKQDMVSKALDMLQVKMGGEGKPSTDTPVAEPPKAEAAHEPAPAPAPVKEAKEVSAHEHEPAKEEAGHEHAPAKELAAHESPDPKAGTAHEPPKKGTDHEPVTAKETVAHEQMPAKEATAQEHAPTKERAKHETAPAKVEAAPVAEPVKAENQLEPATAKPITPAKAVVKDEPVSAKQAASGKWGVNLGAFKQEWFAKSKAAEYARQGVFAEVVPVPGKNSMMYRLRVGGFKNKAEANSNTARIKQALNLDSVWVSDN